jgi:hypothetical protein
MSSRPLDAKFLYKQIAAVFADLRSTKSNERTAERIVESVLEVLASPLGLRSAHLYRRRADTARLLRSWREERIDLSSELPRRLSSSDDDGILELPWVGRTPNGVTGLMAFDPERNLLGAFYRSSEDDPAAISLLTAALSASSSTGTGAGSRTCSSSRARSSSVCCRRAVRRSVTTTLPRSAFQPRRWAATSTISRRSIRTRCC